MEDTPDIAPAGWLEALAESEAQRAAGQIVDGDEVLRELDACIARLEAKQSDQPKWKAYVRRWSP